MNPTELEQKRNEFRTMFSKLVDDNVLMFLALKTIYRRCLEADEDNWAKTIDAIKEIAGHLTFNLNEEAKQ